MDSKKLFQSKTVWLGVLQAVSGFLLLMVDNDLVKEYPKAVSVIVLVNGVITMALRMMTTLPINWGGGDDKVG